MNKILLVAWREFAATVFTKGFLFGVVFPPVMMAAVFTLMPILMNKAAPRVKGHIAVIDRSPGGAVAGRLEAAFTPEATQRRRDERIRRGMEEAPIPDSVKAQAQSGLGPGGVSTKMFAQTELTVVRLDPGTDVEAAKAPIREAAGKEKDAGGADPRLALVVIPPEAIRIAASPAGAPPSEGKPPEKPKFAPFDMFAAPKLDAEVHDDIETEVRRAVVDARLEAGGLPVEQVRTLIERPAVRATSVTASGDVKTNEVAKMLVPGAFLLLLWISVFSCGQGLLTSTIEEKSSRVMEVLLSAVSPMQLMTGKIVGQMLVGLLILVAYGGLGIVGLLSATLMHLIDPMNLVYLGIYFVIGFAIIASLMAAVGSAVSDIREAQSLMAPIMIVLVIPMVLWFPILRNPNSTFAQVCSFLPPISPFVMVLRLAGSEPVPAWQIPASIVVGFLFVLLSLWFAAKVFRIGVLMYGKPPNFRTLIKWVRMA